MKACKIVYNNNVAGLLKFGKRILCPALNRFYQNQESKSFELI